MSPNWDGLRDVVTAYVSDVAPPGGDSPRAIVLAAIDRLRAALERPRPAPPEPHLEREGNHVRFVDFGGEPLSPDFIPSHESKAARGGSAGTGAAPPTLADVLTWLHARPGASWLATIHDIDKAVAALRGGAAQPPRNDL